MSNTGGFIQRMIDQSRGKSRHNRRNRGASGRRRAQIIFEKTNPALAAAGGALDTTAQKGFKGSKLRKNIALRIKQGVLQGDAAIAALSLIRKKKKRRRLTKRIISG
jgi:hypothetical protein